MLVSAVRYNILYINSDKCNWTRGGTIQSKHNSEISGDRSLSTLESETREPWRRAAPFLLLGSVLVTGVVVGLVSPWSGAHRVEVSILLQDSSPVSEEPAEREANRSIRIAVGSMLTPSSNVKAYQALATVVGEQLDRPTELVQRPSYGAVNELLLTGEIDAAFICSGAYVDIRHSGDVELLVVPVVKGATTYSSLIVVPESSSASSFDDLRGKSFAFVDPLSNTGYFYPSWRVRQEGTETSDYFDRTTFSQSHERSVWMVARGIVDAAAVDNLVFDAMLREDSELENVIRVIETSQPFGIPPVVAAKRADSKLTEEIREILLKLHEHQAGRDALTSLGFDRFTKGNVDDYDGVDVIRAPFDGVDRR